MRSLTHLPIIVDPSHATGQASLVKPMAFAAVACGADGVMIEVHDNPARALSDGNQSVTPSEFDEIMKGILRIREAIK